MNRSSPLSSLAKPKPFASLKKLTTASLPRAGLAPLVKCASRTFERSGRGARSVNTRSARGVRSFRSGRGARSFRSGRGVRSANDRSTRGSRSGRSEKPRSGRERVVLRSGRGPRSEKLRSLRAPRSNPRGPCSRSRGVERSERPLPPRSSKRSAATASSTAPRRIAGASSRRSMEVSIPRAFCSRFTCPMTSSPTREMTAPVAPARPVRPERCK